MLPPGFGLKTARAFVWCRPGGFGLSPPIRSKLLEVVAPDRVGRRWCGG
jgi:hypothetical protein